METRVVSLLHEDKIIMRSGNKIHFIELGKISHIEACNYYALIHTENRTFIIRQSLDELERKLEDFNFLRIHRSVILNLSIFTFMERENKTFRVHTTIGKEFRVSRYRQKEICSRILVGT